MAVRREADPGHAIVGALSRDPLDVADAPHPPPNPPEFALLLMATHRAYLLDKFGSGNDTPDNRQDAIAALAALWRRLLAK